MTLYEKLRDILSVHYISAEDNIASADSVAIEELKQVIREMCDKQKAICSLDAERSDWNNITNAPYPEELQ